MYRFLLVVLTFVACLVWAGSTALAEGGDEFQLPPVKLKPDRPTQAKPIPPTPDERAAPPAETPKEPPPAEKPPAPPKVAPPAEKAPEPPKVAPPVLAPKAPPEEPVEAPKKPPTLELPTEPPAEPTLPPVLAKPAKAPAKTAKPIELPPEPALPPPVTPKPAKAPDLALPPAGQEPRRTAVQKELVEAQVEPQPAVDLAGMGEVGLVEEVSRTRKAYARALTALKDYYVSRATVAKIQWIDSELAAFDKVPKIQYLVVAELAGPNLRPTRRIEAADQLYKEGINYKDYPAFPPGKKDYLKVALEKFQTIIEKYPESDKIADAAFRMGEIYGGWYFEDWARAVQSYERCWQWDPATPNPALFNAAKIYDDKLKNRVKAVELYNRVVAESKIEDHVNQAQDRIRALTGT